MSTLSQFAGGTDRFRLKFKNGRYIDQAFPISSNIHIRDFTAQNDSLMISMTSGGVLIGKRVDQLYPAILYNTTTQIANYDYHIGGDPYADVTSINRAGIARYTNTSNIRAYRAANGRIPQVTFDGGPSNGYSLPVASIATSGTNNTGFARFVYTSNNQLFYIHWQANTDNLYVYRWDTGTLNFVTEPFTYGGSKTTLFSVSGNLNGVDNGPGSLQTCTAPEIDPSTGNIFMLARRQGTDWFRIQYTVATASWTVLDVTTRPANWTFNSSAACLAIDNTGTNMLLTTGFSANTNVAATLYWNSADGGNTWTQRDLPGTNIVMRQAGYANGKFYSINTSSTNAFYGDLVSVDAANLADPESWDWEENCDISQCVFLRNNGLGTACYVSTGGTLSQAISQAQHGILRLTGNS